MNMKYRDVLVTKGKRIDWKATQKNIYQWLRAHPDTHPDAIDSTTADAMSAGEMTKRLRNLAKRHGSGNIIEAIMKDESENKE